VRTDRGICLAQGTEKTCPRAMACFRDDDSKEKLFMDNYESASATGAPHWKENLIKCSWGAPHLHEMIGQESIRFA
jgi:hypothetical protein